MLNNIAKCRDSTKNKNYSSQTWSMMTKPALVSPSDTLHKPVSSTVVASSELSIPPPPFQKGGPMGSDDLKGKIAKGTQQRKK